MSNRVSELSARVEALARTAWSDRSRVRSLVPLAGDASSRRYVRVSFTGPGPETAVLMIQSDSGLSISSDELAVFSESPREVPFLNVQRYLRSAGIAVPEIYGAEGDLILLEDVGDTTLWEAVQDQPPEARKRFYCAAINELVKMQTAGERSPEASCIAFQQSFDARLFRWELEHFLEYGFTGRSITADDRRELQRRFEELSAELAACPTTLAHRDYHSWNLFVHEERIRVIDFQDALLAPLPYDLATLLNDRATPRAIDPELERELITHFLCSRAETHAEENLPLQEFLPDYYRFVFQKSLKIVGRFHYLETVKGRTGYVVMLPDTFATLRRCFAGLPALEPFRRILRRSFPELE